MLCAESFFSSFFFVCSFVCACLSCLAMFLIFLFHIQMDTINDLAAGATDKFKGMTDQMAIPSVGMNMPKSVTDQISSLKGSSVVTGESHFLEV